MNQRKTDLRQLTVMALLCAVAYAVVLAFLPIKIQFLSFEIKDSILAIGAFLYGPLSALLSVVVVALLELVTFSETGPIGLLMNVVSSSLFLFPAAFIYKKNRSLKGAVIGLICGVVCVTVGMVLWNWLITPIYMKVPREQVVGMLLPLILPFNLLKAGINAVVTLLLYKTVVTALRKAKLFPVREEKAHRTNPLFLAIVGTLFIALAAIVLVWSGII